MAETINTGLPTFDEFVASQKEAGKPIPEDQGGGYNPRPRYPAGTLVAMNPAAAADLGKVYDPKTGNLTTKPATDQSSIKKENIAGIFSLGGEGWGGSSYRIVYKDGTHADMRPGEIEEDRIGWVDNPEGQEREYIKADGTVDPEEYDQSSGNFFSKIGHEMGDALDDQTMRVIIPLAAYTAMSVGGGAVAAGMGASTAGAAAAGAGFTGFSQGLASSGGDLKTALITAGVSALTGYAGATLAEVAGVNEWIKTIGDYVGKGELTPTEAQEVIGQTLSSTGVNGTFTPDEIAYLNNYGIDVSNFQTPDQLQADANNESGIYGPENAPAVDENGYPDVDESTNPPTPVDENGYPGVDESFNPGAVDENGYPGIDESFNPPTGETPTLPVDEGGYPGVDESFNPEGGGGWENVKLPDWLKTGLGIAGAIVAGGGVTGGGGDGGGGGTGVSVTDAELEQAKINAELWNYYQTTYKPLITKYIDRTTDTGVAEGEKRQVAGQIRGEAMKGVTPPALSDNPVTTARKLSNLARTESGMQVQGEGGSRSRKLAQRQNIIDIGKGQATTAQAGLNELASQSVISELSNMELSQMRDAAHENAVGSVAGAIAAGMLRTDSSGKPAYRTLFDNLRG